MKDFERKDASQVVWTGTRCPECKIGEIVSYVWDDRTSFLECSDEDCHYEARGVINNSILQCDEKSEGIKIFIKKEGVVLLWYWFKNITFFKKKI